MKLRELYQIIQWVADDQEDADDFEIWTCDGNDSRPLKPDDIYPGYGKNVTIAPAYMRKGENLNEE